MNNFERKVLNFIYANDMIKPSSKILVGFSGGADSCALVLALYELKTVLDIELIAVHVNHGIRKEAYLDEEFVTDFCRKYQIKCITVARDIPLLSKEWSMTEEEAGRKARYDAFYEIAKDEGADYIAVAHHENDLAETLLMNLFRGTGLHGAAGIRPVRDNIIRPLLGTSRKEIEDYLEEKGITYRTDATNVENIHTRNKIRNELIPYVEKEINERAVEHLSRAADSFLKADEYIRRMAQRLYDKTVTLKDGAICIDLKSFNEEDQILRENVILRCFEELTPARKDITYRHVDAVLKLSKGKEGCAFLDLPYGLVAKREYEFLRIYLNNADCDNSEFEAVFLRDIITKNDTLNIQNLGMVTTSVIEYNGVTTFPTSQYTKWFDYDRIQEAFFRLPLADDYICFKQNGSIRKKKLSKYMTDVKIPKDERKRLVVLAIGNEIAWIPGFRMNCNFLVGPQTKKVLEINISNGGNFNG